VVVLLSGTGTNFIAIERAASHGSLPIDIRAVLSDRPQAAGLARARSLQLPTVALSPSDYHDRESHDQAMIKAIDHYTPHMVILAGYMRILTSTFVAHYANRILNIHPSLLPALKGLHTHQRALDERLTEHGCSVHLVTETLDGGPVIAQAPVPILSTDDAHTLAARVQKAEHRLYPTVLEWIALGRLQCQREQIFLDGSALSQPVRLPGLYE
jgi:phosphoribosylglycinamide formyltransferase-1